MCTKAWPLPKPVSGSLGMCTFSTEPCLPKSSRSSLSPLSLSKFLTKTLAPTTSSWAPPSLAAAAAVAGLAAGRLRPAGFDDDFGLAECAGPPGGGGGGGVGSPGGAGGTSSSPGSGDTGLPSRSPPKSPSPSKPPRRPSREGRPCREPIARPLPKTSPPPLSRPGPREGSGDPCRSMLVQEPPPAVDERTPRALSLVKVNCSVSRSDLGSPKAAACWSLSCTCATTPAACSFESLSIKKDVDGDIRWFAMKASNTGSRSDAGANNREGFDPVALTSGSGDIGASKAVASGTPRSSSPSGVVRVPGAGKTKGGTGGSGAGPNPEAGKPGSAEPSGSCRVGARAAAAAPKMGSRLISICFCRIKILRLPAELVERLLREELPLEPDLELPEEQRRRRRRSRRSPRGRLPPLPPISAQFSARRNQGFAPHSPCWTISKNCLREGRACRIGS
mmetsp:Transcript_45289/g.145162  ORF Transcript_45289/g.145162 Transcript_45289/m.145162 type:complete len:449 (-) Transcript_45289:194-1540(-)